MKEKPLVPVKTIEVGEQQSKLKRDNGVTKDRLLFLSSRKGRSLILSPLESLRRQTSFRRT